MRTGLSRPDQWKTAGVLRAGIGGDEVAIDLRQAASLPCRTPSRYNCRASDGAMKGKLCYPASSMSLMTTDTGLPDTSSSELGKGLAQTVPFQTPQVLQLICIQEEVQAPLLASRHGKVDETQSGFFGSGKKVRHDQHFALEAENNRAMRRIDNRSPRSHRGSGRFYKMGGTTVPRGPGRIMYCRNFQSHRIAAFLEATKFPLFGAVGKLHQRGGG